VWLGLVEAVFVICCYHSGEKHHWFSVEDVSMEMDNTKLVEQQLDSKGTNLAEE
jgi:hypothetical protein